MLWGSGRLEFFADLGTSMASRVLGGFGSEVVGCADMFGLFWLQALAECTGFRALGCCSLYGSLYITHPTACPKPHTHTRLHHVAPDR